MPELATPENLAKVKAGMTLAEFEAVLGKGVKMTREQFAAEAGVGSNQFPAGNYYRWGKGETLTACMVDGKAAMVAKGSGPSK